MRRRSPLLFAVCALVLSACAGESSPTAPGPVVVEDPFTVVLAEAGTGDLIEVDGEIASVQLPDGLVAPGRAAGPEPREAAGRWAVSLSRDRGQLVRGTLVLRARTHEGLVVYLRGPVLEARVEGGEVELVAAVRLMIFDGRSMQARVRVAFERSGAFELVPVEPPLAARISGMVRQYTVIG